MARSNQYYTRDLDGIRNEYITLAKELVYPSKVINKLKQACDEDECIRILHDARMNLD